MKYSSLEILMFFKEIHRLSSPLDFMADSTIQINEETTIEDWRISGDLVGWKKLAKSLNEEFELSISLDEWKEVLEPAKKQKLIGVCEMISYHANKRLIVSMKKSETLCKSASIFRFIKRELKRRGVEVDGLKPNSPIEEYLSKNYEEIIPIIAKLEGGIIERLEVIKSSRKRSIWQKLNVFDLPLYKVKPIGVVTFRDYIMKMKVT